MSAETAKPLFVLLESSSQAVDTDSDIDYTTFVQWETAVFDAWEDGRIYYIFWRLSCMYMPPNQTTA